MDPVLSAVRESLVKASRACRRVADQGASIRAFTKDDRSPVTVADFASQAVVAHTLKMRLGALRMVAEESRAAFEAAGEASHHAALEALRPDWPDVTRQLMMDAVHLGAGEPHAEGFWTLDPVDGTKGFLRRQQFAIALAWIEGGVPTVGGVAGPNLGPDSDPEQPATPGTLLLARRGQGVLETTCDELDAPFAPLVPRARPAEGLVVCAGVEKAHADLDQVGRLVDALGGGRTLHLDSQCKYLVVARGQADAYLRPPKDASYEERIWDHAAAALVAQEAGCVVSDLDGRRLDFGRGRTLSANRGILCASRDWHPRLLAALA
jgi:3'(2'), 5'-bisphosphate nucleotidase